MPDTATTTENVADPVPVCEVCCEEEANCECFRCPSCDFRSDSNADYCSTCDACVDTCCQCDVCPACDRRYRAETAVFCRNCERCTEHPWQRNRRSSTACCDCISCEGCDDVRSPDRTCAGCYRCFECCSCSTDKRGVKLADYALTFHTADKRQHTENKSKRYIAVEIEVDHCDEGTAVNQAASRWQASIVEDGSLPDSGYEINTAPASGDLFVEQIRDITAALAQQDAEVSSKCGLHVHVDARDFTYYDIRRLIMVYAAVETALYDMVSPSRRSNNYCRPCGPAYLQAIQQGRLPKSSKKGIIKALYKEESTKDRRNHKYQDCRYYALNLHSWLYRGTVECRMFSGTVQQEKITNWGMLWAAILDFAMQATEAKIEQLTQKNTARGFLLCLCPTEPVKQWVQARWQRWD